MGHRIQMEQRPPVWREIVDVARNLRQRNLEEDSRPVFYRPDEQGLDLGIRAGRSIDGVAPGIGAMDRLPTGADS